MSNASTSRPTTPPASAPVAATHPTSRTHHGDTVVDEYEWLRQKEAPEVLAHLEAENAWTDAQTADQAALREAIFGDIKARTKETDLSIPTLVAHRPEPEAEPTWWWYYSRSIEGRDYTLTCRIPAGADPDPTCPPDVAEGHAAEQVVLDGNAEAEGHEFFSLGALSVSPDGTLLAWSVDHEGDERFTLHVRRIDSAEPVGEPITDVAYGVAWAGAQHLFYTRADAAWRPCEVWRHRLDGGADVRVFSDPDERFFVGVGASVDDRWVLVQSGSKLTAEVWLLSTATPEGELRCVTPRRDGVDYSVEPAGDRLLVLHNDPAHGASADFALAEAPLEATDHTQWRKVIASAPGVRLTDVAALASHVIVESRRDGLTAVQLVPRTAAGDLDLAATTDVTFDEPIGTVGAHSPSRYDATTIRVGHTSLVTPASTWEVVLGTGERTLLKRQPVLDHPERGPYRSEDFLQTREWATAADGTRIPISIVRHRDVALDGSAPLVLYGYGSYEHSIDPSFSIMRVSLLERGVVWAIAHVRGGGELGRAWYDEGKMMNKVNTFTDFVACADHLVANGWTSSDRLAALGGSAGGLLMGAVANLAPDTFRAIVAQVPFVDPLTSILNPDLPLTVTEWEEWGDPLHDAEAYAYIKSYAPYDNVTAQTYPAVLAVTSLNDTRVLYVEPAKWVARLRAVAANGRDDASTGREILLRTEMAAGHGGGSGRYTAWREAAFWAAWTLAKIAPATLRN